MLALFGGEKSFSKEMSRYNPIGKEEVEAAIKVVESGKLSGFIGAWGPSFFGGQNVKNFENHCANFFRVKHAIAVNSWTSGLISAIGALDLCPGDEVIVPTWTMSATAMSVLHWNGIPVFADIDPETFCISPDSVIDNLSTKTKGIIAVDIFGQSANIDQLRQICDKYGLFLLSDSAQAPGSFYDGRYSGTLADIGGISLNFHKHINTGEGGVLLTDSDQLSQRMKLIRNHAESVVEGIGEPNLSNMIGHNFRMGEIEAAIGIEQLKKLPNLVAKRILLANKLTYGLKKLEGLELPKITMKNSHVFYKYAMRYDYKKFKYSKFEVIEMLSAEGVPGLSGYYVNIHLLPMFQKKIAYGKDGFPWNSPYNSRNISYKKGICPIAEEMQDFRFIGLDLCEYEFTEEDIDGIVFSFEKVWKFITN